MTPRAQPARIPARRTPGDVLAGLVALVALVGLVGGVPYALLRFAGPPITPDLLELGDLAVLGGSAGTDTIVAILLLFVWLAWLQLVVCVIVEVYAGLRRVGLPARVPLAGGTQALANRLVSAVLLLFTASVVAVPLAKTTLPPPAKPAVVAAELVAPAQEARAPLAARSAKKVYVVQPPHGRHHESLWEIAEKCLGDGRRYPEIYRLNQHKEQPDGSRLRMADLIRPGWVLDMPDDAVNVHIVPADQGRRRTLAAHPGKPAELDGRTQTIERDDAGATRTAERPADTQDGTRDGTAERPGTGERGPGDARHDLNGDGTGATDGRPAPGDARESPSRDIGGAEPPANDDRPTARREGAGPEPAAEGRDRADVPGAGDAAGTHDAAGERVAPDGGPAGAAGEPGLELVDYLAAASLAAAGLLAALGRRRRRQLWHRAFGRRVARPTGDAAAAELALRLGADAPGARMLDIGLRLLGRALAAQQRTPPAILAAHLSPRSLDLWIHPSDDDAPAPWTAHDGGQVWRLAAHEGRMLDEQAVAGAAAPYPGLVSLGTDASGRVLVDLEAAQGLINISGAHTTAALAALAVELATNHWSDRMRLTLVGFGEELASIAPDRIRCAGSLSEVLPELEERAETVAGDPGVLTGRVRSRADDPAWPPHYLLSAIAPTPEEARRLARLARTGERTAAGYVVAGRLPHATWTWEIDEQGRVTADALGFEVAAQLLPRRHYRAVVELFRTAERFDGEALSSAPEPPVRQVAPAIEVRLLGPIEITGTRPIEEGRLALATEMVVYLATHPGGVHPVVLGGVLWPRGVQSEVRDATIARVAQWLGTDSAGRPHLAADESGRLRLGPEVRTDWTLFRALVRRAERDATARLVLLDRALRLVRGPLLSGRPAGRYAWLAADDLEYDVVAEVADAAHRLCEERLARGEPAAAVAAVRAGLLLAADDEGLWRDLLRATHAAGDPAGLRAVVDALNRRAASHPYGGGMAPETEALIDELVPRWRLHSLPSA